MSSKQKRGSCKPPPFARSASVNGTTLTISLNDGTTATCSLKPYPGLRLAPERALKKVRVIRPGLGIQWPDLGHELGVEGLLKTCRITKKPARRRR